MGRTFRSDNRLVLEGLLSPEVSGAKEPVWHLISSRPAAKAALILHISRHG